MLPSVFHVLIDVRTIGFVSTNWTDNNSCFKSQMFIWYYKKHVTAFEILKFTIKH